MNAYHRPVRALALLAGLGLAGLGLAGCAAPPRPKPDAAMLSSCRERTERQFNRQNRDLLSYQDNTGTPFSTSFDSGITSAGLSRRFARDQMMSSCVGSSGAPSGGNESSFSRDIDRTPTLTGP